MIAITIRYEGKNTMKLISLVNVRLIKGGAQQGNTTKTALMIAAEQGNIQLVKELLYLSSHGGGGSYGVDTMLMHAIDKANSLRCYLLNDV